MFKYNADIVILYNITINKSMVETSNTILNAISNPITAELHKKKAIDLSQQSLIK